MSYDSWDSVPMWAVNGGGGAALVRRAVAGLARVKLVIPIGNSLEAPSGAGVYAAYAKHRALLPYQKAIGHKLHCTGTESPQANNSYMIARHPVRNAVAGGTVLQSHAALTTDFSANGVAALKSALPANLGVNSQNTPYVVPNGGAQGFFFNIQSRADYAPSECGIGAGRGASLWTNEDGKTYVTIYALTCQRAGLADELLIKVTGTNTLNAAVGVGTGAGTADTLTLTSVVGTFVVGETITQAGNSSIVLAVGAASISAKRVSGALNTTSVTITGQTSGATANVSATASSGLGDAYFVTGSGGVSSMALRSAPLLDGQLETSLPTVKSVRIGPIPFNGYLCAQINILGAAGEAVVINAEGDVPDAMGLGACTIGATGGMHCQLALSSYPRSNVYFNEYAARNTDCSIILVLQMSGLNEVYIGGRTPDQCVDDMLALLAYWREAFGPVPVWIPGCSYKDNSEDGFSTAQATDLTFEQVDGAIFTRLAEFGDAIYTNGHRIMDVFADNRTGENLQQLTPQLGDNGEEIPGMITTDAYQIWAATNSFATGQLVACPSAPGPLLVTAGGTNIIRPFSSGAMAVYGSVVRQHGSVNASGVADSSHKCSASMAKFWEEHVRWFVHAAHARGGGTRLRGR